MPEMSLRLILLIVGVGTLTGAAAVSDLRTRRIPNLLTLPALLLGLGYQAAFFGWAGLADAGLAFVMGFGILFVLWLIGGGGGGDAKLMGALSVWLGFDLTLTVMIATIVFVVLATLSQIVSGAVLGHKAPSVFASSTGGRKAKKRKKREQTVAERQQRRLMAFAVPVALATWVVMIWNLSSL